MVGIPFTGKQKNYRLLDLFVSAFSCFRSFVLKFKVSKIRKPVSCLWKNIDAKTQKIHSCFWIDIDPILPDDHFMFFIEIDLIFKILEFVHFMFVGRYRSDI